MKYIMFICTGMSSLVGGSVHSSTLSIIHQTAVTDACKYTILHIQPVFLRMNLRGSKHGGDIRN